MSKKKIISKSGTCPICNSKKLEYGSFEFNADSVLFDYACKKCGFLGIEEYSCNFIGHSDTYGESFWNEGEETNNE